MKSAAEYLLKKTAQSVWRRGEEYADQGLVEIQSATEKSVEALVKGSQPYHVRLSFPGSGISKQCDCPYAAGSKARHAACKHMVAAALAWDESRGIARPGAGMVEAETIPPPLVTRAQINALYDDPLNADLNILRIAADERGTWSRPHAKLPLMPSFGAVVTVPLTLKEVKTALAEIKRWARRSSFDPYFCAGEMTAAFCEVLRLVKKRLAATDVAAAVEILGEAVRFHHKLLESIDSSDGVHLFHEAHLRDLCEALRLLLPKDEKQEEWLEEIGALEEAISRY